jgi:hypothetical protein
MNKSKLIFYVLIFFTTFLSFNCSSTKPNFGYGLREKGYKYEQVKAARKGYNYRSPSYDVNRSKINRNKRLNQYY